MDNEEAQYRYLFTVRQEFCCEPEVDTFHMIRVPVGITQEQADIMLKLNEDFCKEEMAADTLALKGMRLRLRFNTNMYQSVCIVNTTIEISTEDLNTILKQKFKDKKLPAFLKESALLPE